MEYAFEGIEPAVHSTAAVCAEATLIGDVTVAEESSVWPGAVLRGDVGPVRIGPRSHVEDNCVLHHASVGEEVMLGHGAVLNGASVGDRVLVGMNSTINMDASIGDRCIVAPNAVVPQGREVPDESFVRGVPAEVIPAAETPHDVDDVLETYSPSFYADLASRHEALFDRD